jgi:hypothetical protein
MSASLVPAVPAHTTSDKATQRRRRSGPSATSAEARCESTGATVKSETATPCPRPPTPTHHETAGIDLQKEDL